MTAERQYQRPGRSAAALHLRVTMGWLLMLVALGFGHAAHGQETWAIVNVSVCNTRAAADYDAGMESQALLGMPVRVLGTQDEWTRIQTPEGYEHWTLSAAIQPMSRQAVTTWNRSPQVVVTALWGSVYGQPSRQAQTVGDVVAGNRLQLTGSRGRFYRVAYPDGRTGYLPKSDAMPLDRWRRQLDNRPEAILRTAHRLMGLPYMWGGTSPKGVDCSGFVRTVLMMHDIIIPRNASQQARCGQRLEIGDFSDLQPGDLLFFGRKAQDGRPERVLHVAFYLGGKRFIHALGCVRIGSFDPADPLYDAYDHDRLLFAARLLPYINRSEELFTTDQSEYYR